MKDSLKWPNALVLMSGGIDSAACASFLKAQGYEIHGVFIDYGQAAAKQERKAATNISKHLNIPLFTYELSGQNFAHGELFGRNAFLILSSIFLSSYKSGLVAIGIHGGTQYFDCSTGFFVSTNKFLDEISDGSLKLIAPFLDWSKADVFDYFISCGIPINKTYSCEIGKDLPCGNCTSCKDRKKLQC